MSLENCKVLNGSYSFGLGATLSLPRYTQSPRFVNVERQLS